MDHKRDRDTLIIALVNALLTAVALCVPVTAASRPDYTFRVATGWEGPVYSVTITGGGASSAGFCGKHATFFLGCRTDSLGHKQWEEFNMLLAKIEFPKLKEEYKSDKSDMPVYELCSQRPKKCVRIEDSSDIPENLRHLDRAIADVLDIEKWIYGSVPAVEQLRSEGYDFNQHDRADHSTILIRAVKRSSTSVVTELLRYGADANGLDQDGNSALLWSVSTQYASYEKARAIIEAGADVCRKDADGRTPLEEVRLDLARILLPETKARLEKIQELLLIRAGRCSQR
jgi:Ankyrin repeats (3 copies)